MLKSAFFVIARVRLVPYVRLLLAEMFCVLSAISEVLNLEQMYMDRGTSLLMFLHDSV